VLHSDLNSFYASVECLFNPAIRDLPVAVGGDPEARHGIILAKNEHAKKYGVITGQPVWRAKQLCPNLVMVRPNFDRYLQFSRMAREIYYQYTDQIENFGIDEAWLDVTGSVSLFGNGEKIAHTIRKKIYSELGITVSVGVSFCKVFAKLGSDYQKPDAVTVFDRANYKDKVWPLPVGDLLYVGRATEKKLNSYGIKSIGDLANFDVKLLYGILGKVGVVLHRYANGIDHSKVAKNDVSSAIKSVGNSTTTPRGLETAEDVWLTIVTLSESVAARLRENGLKCNTVQVYIREENLFSCERQAKLSAPTFLSAEIAKLAMEIFKTKYNFTRPLRSVGVRACDLVSEDSPVQLNLFHDYETQKKMETLERTVDSIRAKFGHFSIQRALMLTDRQLSGHNPKDHVIHPVGVFNDSMEV
jgi:DNA polymerase-4